MIKIAKLITGEDVIADVAEFQTGPNNGCWKFKKPVKMIFTERGLGMMPLSPLVKSGEMVISKNHILYLADVEDDLANEYNAKFGNGIVVPNSDLTL